MQREHDSARWLLLAWKKAAALGQEGRRKRLSPRLYRGYDFCWEREALPDNFAEPLHCIERDFTMTVTILYFAAVRELLGISEEALSDLPSPLSVSGLADMLVRRHPALAPHLVSVRFAVNEAFSDAGAPVADGDTVALIPPVSGG